MILFIINYHKPEVKHEIAGARLLCVDSILGYLDMVKFRPWAETWRRVLLDGKKNFGDYSNDFFNKTFPF